MRPADNRLAPCYLFEKLHVMELGILKISSSLLMFIATGALGWALLRLYVTPRARMRLDQARGEEVPSASARLVVVQSASSLAAAMALSPLVVALLYGYAQVRIEGSAGHPAKLQSLIDTRALLERVLEPLTAVALEVWVVALLAASIIWILARHSASRLSWSRALEARKKAHAASLSGVTDEELLAEANRRTSKRLGDWTKPPRASRPATTNRSRTIWKQPPSSRSESATASVNQPPSANCVN